jgi:hypothetical protein
MSLTFQVFTHACVCVYIYIYIYIYIYTYIYIYAHTHVHTHMHHAFVKSYSNIYVCIKCCIQQEPQKWKHVSETNLTKNICTYKYHKAFVHATHVGIPFIAAPVHCTPKPFQIKSAQSFSIYLHIMHACIHTTQV